MNNKELQIIKKEILHYLADDFKDNQAIFDREYGYQIFNRTDLEKKLNNKEKVIVIDQEELILRIMQLHKSLKNERNAKERELNKTALPKSKELIRKRLEIIDNKQETYMEIINLIKEL